MNELLEQARENVAARYPDVIGMTLKGEPVYNPARRGIMGGYWDGGKLVSDEVDRLRLLAREENFEEG